MGWIADVVLEEPVESVWGNAIRDRTVTPFANAAERDASIPTPAAGMVCYLTDPDVLEVYNGTGWSLVPIAVDEVGAWTAWAFALVDGQIGASPFVARYGRTGRTITGRFWFQFASGGVMSPAGVSLGIRLPVPAVAGSPRQAIGSIEMFRQSSNVGFPGALVMLNSDGSNDVARCFYHQTYGGTIAYYQPADGGGPFPWSPGDSISGTFAYEAAS